MARPLVPHRVADYDAWRKVYDSVAPMQAAGGVTAESVHRWRVIPTTSWLSITSTRFQPAQRFFASPELRDAMQRAGRQDGASLRVLRLAQALKAGSSWCSTSCRSWSQLTPGSRPQGASGRRKP